MIVQPSRLDEHLSRQSLAPFYFVWGEEPQQMGDVLVAIRGAARNASIEERLIFDLETGFDWNALPALTNSMSLFSERRMIEIRLGSKKPDKHGIEILRGLGVLEGDDVFLISSARDDAATKRTKWHQQLCEAGVTINVRPLNVKQTASWLEARAISRNKRLDREVAALIAARNEGNLLAAAQEVEKLCLLVDSETIAHDSLATAISDGARFDVFALVDAALEGAHGRSLRVLRSLREQGSDPTLLRWAFHREIATLLKVRLGLDQGLQASAAMAKAGVWKSRQALVRRAVNNHSLTSLGALLDYAHFVDRQSKGARAGDPWNTLEFLTLAVDGTIDEQTLARQHKFQH
ncbi:MAG: DNA polymerase III subunit delta [Pseudomonadota bacterium]